MKRNVKTHKYNVDTYQLIHVPKTGGTAFYTFLQENFPNVFREYMYEGQRPHELKAISVKNPIVIIREPFERIFSIYRYWRSGSEMFLRNLKEPKSELSFCEFLDDVNIFNVWSSYIWVDHLLPQCYWLGPDDYSKTIVIKYRKDLSACMGALLEYLELEVPEKTIEKVNVTLDCFDYEISQTEKQKIIDRYDCDFELWNNLCSNKSMFRKVI